MKLLGSTSRYSLQEGKSRVAEREARRQEAAEESKRETARRIKKRASSNTLVARVEDAKLKLAGWTVAQAIAAFDAVSMVERDVYLLAEELTRNRVGIIKNFSPVRQSVRDAYVAQTSDPDAEAPDNKE